jgi:hypothetical protein
MFHPCGFYSKKNSPAECNYEIYDKEMLAIVRCLENWDSDLRSVREFQVRTDHKNLEYFMTARKLTERQMRWSLTLSKYNFTIMYIPGKENVRADALSRRDQDMPKGADSRVDSRTIQLLKPVTSAPQAQDTELVLPAQAIGPLSELEELWQEALRVDQSYDKIVACLREEKRTFPAHLKLKVSVAECTLDKEGRLLFRDRLWVPELEELRTKMIQGTHDSRACGHPGRDSTGAILARQYFWPRMYEDVRRFVRNCDACGASTPWRDRRQGFLKPLPIPDRL